MRAGAFVSFKIERFLGCHYGKNLILLSYSLVLITLDFFKLKSRAKYNEIPLETNIKRAFFKFQRVVLKLPQEQFCTTFVK